MEARATAFGRAARQLALEGVQALGPTLAVAVLRFAARATEDLAREAGHWNEEYHDTLAAEHEAILAELARRRAARKASRIHVVKS